MDVDRSHLFSTVKQDAELHENLKVKFVAGEKERKELYNKILELKGMCLHSI